MIFLIYNVQQSSQLTWALGSRTNNLVQNKCIQHHRVQIYTDAAKRGTDTS